MSIGQKIIEEIGKGGMFSTHDIGGPVECPLIYVWSSGAAEQLDALVEEYSRAKVEALEQDKARLVKIADRLLTDLENVVEGLDTEEAKQVVEMRAAIDAAKGTP